MFGLFFDMIPNGVCTTGYWQTSGRLVQELNVCTAAVFSSVLGSPLGLTAVSRLRTFLFSTYFLWHTRGILCSVKVTCGHSVLVVSMFDTVALT